MGCVWSVHVWRHDLGVYINKNGEVFTAHTSDLYNSNFLKLKSKEEKANYLKSLGKKPLAKVKDVDKAYKYINERAEILKNKKRAEYNIEKTSNEYNPLFNPDAIYSCAGLIIEFPSLECNCINPLYWENGFVQTVLDVINSVWLFNI